MKLVKKETIIGACVLIALATLFFGIEYLKGVSIFKPSNYYYAVYDNVKGLAVASPVYVNGLKVGQVDDIALMTDRPGKVLTTISLDKDIKIPVGSQAALEGELLGGASISIIMADSHSFYNPGDTLITSNLSSVMESVNNDIMPSLTQILPKVDSLLVSLNTIASNPEIPQLLHNINVATSSLASAAESINATTSTLRSTATSFDASVASLPHLVNELDSIMGNFYDMSSNLNRLSASLANGSVDSIISNIDAVSANLAQFATQLSDPNSTIGRLVNDPSLYDQLSRTTSSLDSLLIDIRKNPKRYIHIKLL